MRLKLKDEELAILKNNATYSWSFCLLNRRISVYSDQKDVINLFKTVYKNFLINELPEESIECYALCKNTHRNQPCVIVDSTLFKFPSEKNFIDNAETIILQAIIEKIDNYLLLHAGVVSKNGNGFILYGPSTSGKSTLVYELLSRNYKFLSDECCAIRSNDLIVEPFPLSLGIRKNSIFINKIIDKSVPIYKGFENKRIVNPVDVFPNCLGKACRAKYLIKLGNTLTEKSLHQKQLIDVAFLLPTPSFVKNICTDNNITLRETVETDNLVVYRFSIPNKPGLTNYFQDICKKYLSDIYQISKDSKKDSNFSLKPSLAPMAKNKASFQILQNLVNRTLHSKLYEKYDGKTSQLLFDIGGFVNTIECFEMTSGQLNEMADLIDQLEEKCRA